MKIKFIFMDNYIYLIRLADKYFSNKFNLIMDS